RCIIPPHCWQAGPRSNPARTAGMTGGSSVLADVGGAGADGALDAEPDVAPLPLPSLLGLTLPSSFGSAAGGPAVSLACELAASWAALRARTAGVRIPSSSWRSVSRKREASHRMM